MSSNNDQRKPGKNKPPPKKKPHLPGTPGGPGAVGGAHREGTELAAEMRRLGHPDGASTGGPGAAPGMSQGEVAGAGAGGKVPAKYLLLEVPNFNSAEDPGEQMTSYLRLGTVPDPWIAGDPEAPRPTGEDLAAYGWFFLDDERKRDGSERFVSVEARKRETARLHTKGGWRDHSDGNRITTTRGDKIEVIRGNYKMIVLGRDDESGGAGWDVSGGHIEGLAAKSCIEWVQTFDGTWKTVETSEKGDTDLTQHGNSITRNFGEYQTNITGSEDERRPVENEEGGTDYVFSPNPHLLDRTWARRIESYTGSSKYRIPLLRDETWVDRLESSTHAHEMSDETRVSGTMDTTTMVGTMNDTTIAGTMNSVTLANVLNVTVGNQANIQIGPMENLTVGAMIDVTIAAMLDIFAGAQLSINVGPQHQIHLLDSADIAPERQEISGTVMRTSAVESLTTGVYKLTAGLILLG